VTCLTEGCRYYATLLSLLGNRNNSMDTLTTPVLLRCLLTNSRKASVSIVALCVKEGKTIHRVSPCPSAFKVGRRQSLEAEEIGPRRDPSQ
jgi:hypothetical protein